MNKHTHKQMNRKYFMRISLQGSTKDHPYWQAWLCEVSRRVLNFTLRLKTMDNFSNNFDLLPSLDSSSEC